MKKQAVVQIPIKNSDHHSTNYTVRKVHYNERMLAAHILLPGTGPRFPLYGPG